MSKTKGITVTPHNWIETVLADLEDYSQKNGLNHFKNSLYFASKALAEDVDGDITKKRRKTEKHTVIRETAKIYRLQ